MKDTGTPHRLEPAGKGVVIYFNGQAVQAYAGETIATALVASGHWVFQLRNENAAGVFCNSGICHGCLVTVDGQSAIKACCTEVAEGQRIETHVVSRREAPQ